MIICYLVVPFISVPKNTYNSHTWKSKPVLSDNHRLKMVKHYESISKQNLDIECLTMS